MRNVAGEDNNYTGRSREELRAIREQIEEEELIEKRNAERQQRRKIKRRTK